jgi:hypothetical protein
VQNALSDLQKVLPSRPLALFRFVRCVKGARLQGPRRKINPFSRTANDMQHETTNEAYETPRGRCEMMDLEVVVEQINDSLMTLE